MLSMLQISPLKDALPQLQSFVVRNSRYAIISAVTVAGYLALRAAMKDRRDREFFERYMNCYIKTIDNALLCFRKQMKDLMEKQRAEKQKHSDEKFRVIDIGTRPGTNLDFYPKGISIVAGESNPYFVDLLLERQKTNPDLERIIWGEDLSTIEDESVDAVVSTLFLCSAHDFDKTFKEIERVLVKGGRLYLFEHVADTSNRIRYIAQLLANPIWRAHHNGCSLTRHVKGALLRHRFQLTSIKEDNGFFGYFVDRYLCGYATKC